MIHLRIICTVFLLLFIVGAGISGCGGVLTSIPDLDTPDGRIFAHRCAGCHDQAPGRGHGVPDPRFRTMAEWEILLPKMEGLINERGLPPLTQAEREAIMRFLQGHAKSS